MGSYTLANARTRVYRTLRDLADTADKQLLTDTEIDDYLGDAASRYSNDRRAVLIADVTSGGTRYLTLPGSFEDGFSVIQSIEYPIDDDPSAYLDPRDVDLYRTFAGDPLVATLVLRTSWAIPSSDKLRVVFTGRRVWGSTAAATTVLDRDYPAVIDLTVSACCDAIAQKYARTSEPILSADSVSTRDKAAVWESRAKRYATRYREAMGSPLATGVVNWDSSATWRGGAWLTHPRYGR
jgi:hypothetical protein